MLEEIDTEVETRYPNQVVAFMSLKVSSRKQIDSTAIFLTKSFIHSCT